ncbi:MAG: 30S ribosomal protein S9 [Nanoarchaeota archaeon]
MKENKKITVSGKRKRAIARAIIQKGDGDIRINNKDYNNLHLLDKLRIEEPIRISKNVLGGLDFNINVTIKGGGIKGQLEAARLAIAKAILKYTNSKKLEKAFLVYDRNLLVADVRRKESSKPGDSKARAKRQSSKR